MPVLRFSNLPDRALVEVRKAVDSDEAFRARVLESLSDSELESMDRGARLFLERPTGWDESLDVLSAEVTDEADRDGAARQAADARRRVESLEQSIERVRAERDAARSDLASVSEERDVLGHRNEELTEELQELSAAVDERGSERDEAVRQLGQAKTLAEKRLRELRSLAAESDSTAATGRPGTPEGATGGPATERDADRSEAAATSEGTAPVARDGRGARDAQRSAPEELNPQAAPVQQLDVTAAAAMTTAVRSADALAESLRSLADSFSIPSATESDGSPDAAADLDVDADVGRDLEGDPGDARSAAAGRAAGSVPAGSRSGSQRRAVRLGRGLSADSLQGLDEYLRRPETFVIVDGYNVSMAGWPQQSISTQRESLLRALGTVAAIAAADIHIVFDGAHDGARPSVSTPLPVRVHFTEAGVEADDRILEFVDDAPLEDAVVVVSSDARVRDGARDRGAVPISTQTLLERIRR